MQPLPSRLSPFEQMADAVLHHHVLPFLFGSTESDSTRFYFNKEAPNGRALFRTSKRFAGQEFRLLKQRGDLLGDLLCKMGHNLKINEIRKFFAKIQSASDGEKRDDG